MKRLFYSILILLMIPSLLMAQGLSLKSINDNLTTNYSTTTATQAWIASQGYLQAADLTAYRLVADSYSTSEVDTLLTAKLSTVTAASTYATITALNLKANSADVYTTSAVDLLLLNKLDISALVPYYTALQIDAKLLDYATTGSVALKASQIQVDSEAVALQNHIGNFAAHGHNSPVGQPSNRLEVTDGAGGWQFTSVAAAGGGVTNAVDLNSSTASFSRLMNGLASNAQTALNQIDQNAATTAEVAAKANTADVYTKSETNDTIANAINAIPPPDFTNYYTKTQTNSTIENAIAAATASVSVNQTVSVTAGEDLTAGDVVSLINSYGTVTAKKNNLAINTSPNGAESVFNAAATTNCKVVTLDTTRFIVIYQGSDGKPYSRVGTVSGSAITWGTESAVLENLVLADATTLAAALIATDKVLVAYSPSVGGSRCVVLSINTSTITVNSPVDTGFANHVQASMTTLDTDKALFCAVKGGGTPYGNANIITISGTIPTGGALAQFTKNAYCPYISCSALSATSAIVAYQDGGNSNYGTAQVLSISGTTITPGTEYVFNSGTSLFIACKALSSTSAAVVFRDSSDNEYGYGMAVSVSGTALSYGSEVRFDGGAGAYANYNSISPINGTTFLLAWCGSSDGANTWYTKTNIGTVSGSSLIFGTASAAVNTNSGYVTTANMSSAKNVVCYQDIPNSNYGTAVVNTWATSDYSAVRGLCTTTTSSGNSAPILLSGTLSAYSDLISGADYFVQSDYSLGTVATSLSGSVIKIGEAINSTTIFCH